MSKSLRYLKALADPTRLRLVRVLSQVELSVNEIVRLLDMGQSRVSRHLAILAQGGLLESRREGLWVYYRATPESPARPLLDALEALEWADPGARETAKADLKRAKAALVERGSRTRQFFDARAGEWDRLSLELLGGFDLAAFLAMIVDDLAVNPGVAVDIGCGTGALLGLLADRSRRAIGVDSSPRMLDRAGRRFGARSAVELRLGEAEHLPLRDGEVDLALMSLALHHLAEPRAGLAEVARVCGRDGVFVLVELGPHDHEELREAQGDRWLGFEPRALGVMAGAAGFVMERKRRHELPSGLRLWIYVFRKNGNGGKRNG